MQLPFGLYYILSMSGGVGCFMDACETNSKHCSDRTGVHVVNRLQVDRPLSDVTELSVGLFSSTQPNPYPTEPPYIKQQLACRKKISLCTSCHHHHPNAHRNNANSITSITVKTNLSLDTRHKVTYIHDMYFFAHLPFQTHDPTQPTKNTNFRPIPDPTQPAGQPNPWTTLHSATVRL